MNFKIMEDEISKLSTPEECEQFAEKCIEYAKSARRKAMELRASIHGSNSKVENELLKAIYAYEEILTKKNGRRTRASRTWQMVNRHGIIGAAERAVNRDIEPMGFRLLVDMGFEELTFESVIVRYPESFKPQIVKQAESKLEELKSLQQ